MSKKRLTTITATIALTALSLLLAGNVGLWLYNPSRFTTVLPSSTLNILQGSAEVQTPATITWEKARNGMKLEPGSRVITGENSQVTLTFPEGSMTKVGPRSDLVITRLEASSESSAGAIVLKQRSGNTWNQVAKVPQSQRRFEVQTRSANVMARGTVFSVDVDKSGKTVAQTVEGQVDVSAQSHLVHVFAGQGTEATPGAPPSIPRVMPLPNNQPLATVSAPAVNTVTDPGGAITSPGNGSRWPFSPEKDPSFGYWAAGAILVTFLGLIYVKLYRWC